jgi:hypothetical protein
MVFVADLPPYFERKRSRCNRAVRSLSWTIAECPIFVIVEREVFIHHDDTDCDGDMVALKLAAVPYRKSKASAA